MTPRRLEREGTGLSAIDSAQLEAESYFTKGVALELDGALEAAVAAYSHALVLLVESLRNHQTNSLAARRRIEVVHGRIRDARASKS